MREQRVTPSEIAQARRTGALHLAHRGLTAVPHEIFTQLPRLRRLDLGGNRIATIPDRIAELTELEELWLNQNPLREVPGCLDHNRKLKVLDLRRTRLRRLPNEVGRLTMLNLIDLDGTVLKPKQWAPYQEGGTAGLMAHLHMRDQRKQAKIKMLQRMREGVYREIWDTPTGPTQVQALLKQVFLCFEDLEDIKSLIRNCERLFPEDITLVNVEEIKAQFEGLQRENERKKLAAELELKIRVIYFDRIQIDTVEGMVHDIYREIPNLEDVKFLIRYAPRVFPEKPQQVTGELIAQNVIDLQTQLARERADAVKGVEMAMRNVYPHVNPPLIIALCEATTNYFRKVDDLKKLAADANVFFPVEFETADPRAVRRAFLKAKREAED